MQFSGTAVRAAIQNDQLVPVFQPIVNLQTGMVSGFEVLTRWKHPNRGLILPKDFIQLAEQQGLIDVLTEKVLHSAFIVARSAAPHLMLNVNISPLQLRNRALPGRIRTLCRDTGWPLEQVTIEITESAIIHNLEMASRVATDLKSMGCRLALDDFGTGYSSLIHLQALPFDELKVDRNFVSEMLRKRESRKIVGAVLELAHNLGLTTVAEGVEDEAQCQILFRLGCHSGQGWLYGKPVPAIELPKCTQCPLICKCPRAGACSTFVHARMDLAASDQAAQLKAIYNSAPVGLCLLDKQMRYVSINSYLAEINGVSISEHLGKTVQEMLPDFFPQFEPYMRAALDGRPPSSVEFVRKQRDGQEIVVLANYAAVYDEAAEVIGVSIAVLDVTARVRAEEALRARAEQYRRFLEQSLACPWVADKSLNMLEVSPKWLAMTGLTEEQSLGIGWLQVVHPDDLAHRCWVTLSAVESLQPFEVRYRLRSRSGEWRWVCSRGWPTFSPSGELIGWFGYLVDVEEHKRETERMTAGGDEAVTFGHAVDLALQ